MFTEAFDESTMSRTQVQLWYNRFKDGRDVNGEKMSKGRSSRPITSTTDENIEAVKKMILDNRLLLTIRELAYDVGISFEQNYVAWTSFRRC